MMSPGDIGVRPPLPSVLRTPQSILLARRRGHVQRDSRLRETFCKSFWFYVRHALLSVDHQRRLLALPALVRGPRRPSRQARARAVRTHVFTSSAAGKDPYGQRPALTTGQCGVAGAARGSDALASAKTARSARAEFGSVPGRVDPLRVTSCLGSWQEGRSLLSKRVTPVPTTASSAHPMREKP